MFLVHTGIVAEVSICFLDDIQGTNQSANERINLQAQIAEAVLARINVDRIFLAASAQCSHSPVVLSQRCGCYLASLGNASAQIKLLYPCVLPCRILWLVDPIDGTRVFNWTLLVTVTVDGALNVIVLSNQNDPFALSAISSSSQELGKKRVPLPLVLFLTNVVATGFIGKTFWFVTPICISIRSLLTLVSGFP